MSRFLVNVFDDSEFEKINQAIECARRLLATPEAQEELDLPAAIILLPLSTTMMYIYGSLSEDFNICFYAPSYWTKLGDRVVIRRQFID